MIFFILENKRKDIEKQEQMESSSGNDPDNTPNVKRATRSISNLASNQMPEVIVN
jgi:hypothetical protein